VFFIGGCVSCVFCWWLWLHQLNVAVAACVGCFDCWWLCQLCFSLVAVAVLIKGGCGCVDHWLDVLAVLIIGDCVGCIFNW